MVEKFRVLTGPILHHTPTHLYLAAHPLLRPYIAHYTISFPDSAAAPGASLTLIPDASGCLVFTLQTELKGVCWGATTKTFLVDNSPDAARMHLFVEFLPGGQRRLTGFHQPDLTDRQVSLPLLDRELDGGVRDLLEVSQDPGELAAGLDKLFLKRLGKFEDLPDSLSGLNALPTATVREIAAGRCYSQRQLGRIFQEGVGMGMKTYLRLLRINRAIRLIRPSIPLTWVAQEAGYYDQSHFNHDFKAVCGTTPRAYLQNLSVFYNETLKF